MTIDARSAARSASRLGAALALATLALAGAGATPAQAASPSPVPSPAGTSPAGPGTGDPTKVVTFGVQPATPTKSGVMAPDSRPFLYYAAAPGSTITDHVAILNYSTKPLTLSVYSTDAVNDDKGGFALLPTSERPTDAGAWTSIGAKPVKVTIPARTKAANGQESYGFRIVPLTVKVPADAAPGDHVGGVVASLVSAANDPNNPNVRLDQRVGTRMFIRVAGALEPNLAIENLSATYTGTLNPVGKGTAVVDFTVANRGNVKLGGRMTVDVSGLLGRQASVTLPDQGLILPGNAVNFSVEVADVLPQVRDTATVTIIPLKLQGDADPELPDVVASTSFWAVPWTLIATILALLLVGWFLWRRRATGRHDAVESTTTSLQPIA